MFTIAFNGPIDLKKTFECGQYFLWKADDSYTNFYFAIDEIPVKARSIAENTIRISAADESRAAKTKIQAFFRAEDDYPTIIKSITIDSLMQKIVNFGSGLRLLKQPPFMCTVSYILSQMSNIPKITKNLEAFCEKFGKTAELEGHKIYLFPRRENVCADSVDVFRDLKYGYRAEYLYQLLCDYPSILDACERGSERWTDSAGTQNSTLDSEQLNKELMNIFGVGQKVADCIQLFAFGDTRLFPVDTWMQKFMQKYYCSEQQMTPVKMRKIGQQLFGEYAGYAQEFIFYYARFHPTEFKFEDKNNIKIKQERKAKRFVDKPKKT